MPSKPSGWAPSVLHVPLPGSGFSAGDALFWEPIYSRGEAVWFTNVLALLRQNGLCYW